ncbi:amyloid-beta A4 precursor protein-binding family A member 1 isoform X2 [Triplophysa dalaica]|uniref:amyloid-beta A4 precursor protein-binding family A member 1 isoform X2 n=1 Tax=Triplophysa dalaica TaxID=1582913 RepID=UPI0024DFC0AB|nr:amyloid-beta A4 precursor protein-binding family A member 1 isoform X2 [Triplophysa dalaica]
MSHKEEPDEVGLRGPPPHRSKQPNGTPLEGGRPRWRPCQLHNPDAEIQGHRHHQHHHANQPGTSRAPPHHRRRRVPGQAQRRRTETGDTDPKAGQLPRHHRSGERLHQHRTRQQHREEQQQAVSTPTTDQTLETSPEDSSQELLTPSPQAEPITDKPDGDQADSVEAQTAHSDVEEPSKELSEEKEQREKSMFGKKNEEEEDYPKETPEQSEQVYGPSKIPALKTTFRSESKRTSPLRVDVPPFTTSPHQMINKPLFQSQQSFPESLRSYNAEPKSNPAYFTTGYTQTNKDTECNNSYHDADHQDELSDSSHEACSDSYPQLSPESHLETSYQTESCQHDLPDPSPASEEGQIFERNQSTSMDECDEQCNLEEDVSQPCSVGSRLHHYDEQSGDEAERSRRVRKSSVSLSLKVQEQTETVKPDKPSTPTQHQPPESFRPSGDAVSLAIKDIREAIEEVKIKAVRSPYTPDKPTEPVWVMRRDVSPVDDFQIQPQFQSYPPSPSHHSQSSPQNTSPIQDVVLPAGAESSGVPYQEDQDIDTRRSLASFPTYVDVPGPCDPEDLIDGIIFAANYLGSTQLLSERTPTKSARMQQAQEAMTRVRQATESGTASSTEVDLFISTQRIKVLSAYTQDAMMDHPLRTISYIADIGNMVVLMARKKMIRSQSAQENLDAADTHHTNPAQDDQRQYKMICHVFESEDAQLIAQSIGQAFSVAYQEFLRANGIDPEDLSQREYSDLLNTQDMYNDDLIHFSKSENCKDVYIEKQKGEILGVVIVESGWGSILPTVIIASLMHAGPAAKSGRLNIGDQIMTVNGTSLVGLPLSTCQSIIKGLKAQSRIKLNIVRCPPVTMVLIRRPDLRYQLGFSVQNGIICSLMRGGIAERGGVRVGHRIIEINGQSVVATPHEKIVHILSNAVGEIHMKTMPAAMYRLLTAQEQPVYI